MALKSIIMALLLLITIATTAMLGEAQLPPLPSQNPIPIPSGGCSPQLAKMAPCVSFLMPSALPNLTSSNPQKACCDAFSGLLSDSSGCMCSLFSAFNISNIPLSLPFPINRTQALSLPSACNLTPPSPTSCKSSSTPGAPLSSPPAAPSASNGKKEVAAAAMSPGASQSAKEAPAPSPMMSGVSAYTPHLTLPLAFALLAAVVLHGSSLALA